MKKAQTDYDVLQSSSDEARRMLRKEELILEVTEAITRAMADHKVTKAQLARRLGKTPAFVTQILNGERNLTLGTIAEVSDALRRDVRVNLVASRRVSTPTLPSRDQQVVYFDFGRNEFCSVLEPEVAGAMLYEEIERWDGGVGLISEKFSPAGFIAAVQLRDVSLREGSLLRGVASAKDIGRARVEISRTARCEVQGGGPGFTVVFEGKVHFILTGIDGRPEPAVEVTCTLDLRFELPEGFESTEGERQAFADGNGVFNAWPYFREFVQSATTRMGLPPFVVPVLRLGRQKAQVRSGKPPTVRSSGRPKRSTERQSMAVRSSDRPPGAARAEAVAPRASAPGKPGGR